MNADRPKCNPTPLYAKPESQRCLKSVGTTKRRYPKMGPRRPIIDGLLNRLIELRNMTDPDLGKHSAGGKHLAALETLQRAQTLTDILAGWAIDHVAGLAAEGLGLVDFQQSGATQEIPIKSADDHRHEINGSKWWREPPDELNPEVARQLLFNLLNANSGAFPRAFTAMVTNALKALEYGEVHPLFRPKKSSRKLTPRAQQGQMEAIGFIYYRTAGGMKKEQAIKQVADAYGINYETVRSWEKRLRRELGSARMDLEISNATKAAIADKEEKKLSGKLVGSWGERYSDASLRDAAERYWASRREKGA